LTVDGEVREIVYPPDVTNKSLQKPRDGDRLALRPINEFNAGIFQIAVLLFMEFPVVCIVTSFYDNIE